MTHTAMSDDGRSSLDTPVSLPPDENAASALLPWRSSPRHTVEQLPLLTDGSLALAEEAQPATQTILVALDDPTIGRTLRAALRRDASPWRVVVASEGQRALDLIAQTRPRIALLDVELTGVDAYFRLMASGETSVLFVTRATSYDLAQLGVREGLLLRKPYDPRDLAGIVRELLAD